MWMRWGCSEEGAKCKILFVPEVQLCQWKQGNGDFLWYLNCYFSVRAGSLFIHCVGRSAPLMVTVFSSRGSSLTAGESRVGRRVPPLVAWICRS